MLFNNKLNLIGKQVGGYTILTLIGHGRYGICFLAGSNTGQTVILKKFKPQMFKQNSRNNAFEAVMLSQLNDIRVPELLGIINEKNFYGFVLEYKPGNTVKDMLFKQNYKFSNEEIFNIGCQLISIIKYLHKNSIVHRDIRIPNVLIDQETVYLVDFGLARWTDPNQYPFDLDFSYLGDFLLYLFYSSYETTKKHKQSPWFDELNLAPEQKLFLKRLLRLEETYETIDDIETDFVRLFKI
ncbi:MAG: protein kinase family protein [Acetobacterium woodii]|nr:protein kinase family protein [Acetobacterium woodii]